jgi:hypothetical protein
MIKPFRGVYPLTQSFGVNKANYIQFGLQGHNGIDYGLPTGTQIIAPHSGHILEAGSDPTGYGNYIKIENDTEGSVLGHLQSFQCKVGDLVSEGQPIALSDNTGNSTGPHLHWGYYKKPRIRTNGYAGFIDQLPLLTSTPAPTLLPEPNPGYAPTFEGQTVEKDGKRYQSYKDSSGKLVWRILVAPVVETVTIPKTEYDSLNARILTQQKAIQELKIQVSDDETQCELNLKAQKKALIDTFIKLAETM